MTGWVLVTVGAAALAVVVGLVAAVVMSPQDHTRPLCHHDGCWEPASWRASPYCDLHWKGWTR